MTHTDWGLTECITLARSTRHVATSEPWCLCRWRYATHSDRESARYSHQHQRGCESCTRRFVDELDGIYLQPPFATLPTGRETRQQGIRYQDIDLNRAIAVVKGYRCTNGLQTMIDLASVLDDLQWEQALESALRKKLVTIGELETISRVRGVKRIGRVLALRPPDALPTESLLETLMVQLIRTEPHLPTPTRQVVVLNKWSRFVARVDLAWPDHGVFLELDGQHHKDQPVYDANRQTAVVAAKGWLPGRFTWHEVTHIPALTVSRLVELFEQTEVLRRRA